MHAAPSPLLRSSSSLIHAIKTTKPLVGVLRMADSEKVPGMGFLYGAMDNAKEEIAKNLDNEEGAYKEIWSIIDAKWDNQLHRHLHAAAYYLNPHFQYEPNFYANAEVKVGLYSCMDKLIPNAVDREKADLQMDAFRLRQGLFGYTNAKNTCKKRAPADWWIAFGDEAPELRNFAVKILSLTCSSSACERNWSTFSQDAHHSFIDDSEIIVDYNRQQLMPGWIPRRLGGGLGGKKESGQLRFGGRERPFRAPLRPIPFDDLKRLGIPPPPEGRYMSRFQVPSPPRRKRSSTDREDRSHKSHVQSKHSHRHERRSSSRDRPLDKRSSVDREDRSDKRYKRSKHSHRHKSRSSSRDQSSDARL